MSAQKTEKRGDCPNFVRQVLEKSLTMRAQSYRSQVKARLLAQVILQIESSKKMLKTLNKSLVNEIAIRKQAEERILHMASHDQLTGLPNRALLMDRLDTSVKLASRHNCKLAIIFIDLDGFKAVNDTYGHQSGDELLQIIASRFNATLRRSDTVARVGGDEFIVLLNRTKSPKDSEIVAQNLLNVIKKPVELQTGPVYVGASLGISLFPDHSTDAKTLIEQADHAMYKVKHEGKNNFAYYQEDEN